MVSPRAPVYIKQFIIVAIPHFHESAKPEKLFLPHLFHHFSLRSKSFELTQTRRPNVIYEHLKYYHTGLNVCQMNSLLLWNGHLRLMLWLPFLILSSSTISATKLPFIYAAKKVQQTSTPYQFQKRLSYSLFALSHGQFPLCVWATMN